MSIVKRPTKEELQKIVDDLHHRRTALLDKYGLLGGGETVNIIMNSLNSMYDKAKEQLDNYEEK